MVQKSARSKLCPDNRTSTTFDSVGSSVRPCNQYRVSQAAETFAQKANVKHNGKYDYTFVNYINCRTKVQIGCPEHGIFEQTPNAHLNGHGCQECCNALRVSVTNKRILQDNAQRKANFVARAENVHAKKYDYSLVSYKNAHTNVTIVCPTHGSFTQLPINHYSGCGCPHCAQGDIVGGYNEQLFEAQPQLKLTDAFLYLAKIEAITEKPFLKIGITVQRPKYRLSKLKALQYQYEFLAKQPMPLYKAYKLEQKLLSTYKQHRYFPTQKFEGYTECFETKVQESLLSQILQENN